MEIWRSKQHGTLVRIVHEVPSYVWVSLATVPTTVKVRIPRALFERGFVRLARV